MPGHSAHELHGLRDAGAAVARGVSLGTARLVFAVGFFVVAFALTLRPGVITRVLGRITGPALIALIVLVVGAAVISPLGPAAAPQAPTMLALPCRAF